MQGRLVPGIQRKSHPRECFGRSSSNLCSPEAGSGQNPAVGLSLGTWITPGFRGCPKIRQGRCSAKTFARSRELLLPAGLASEAELGLEGRGDEKFELEGTDEQSQSGTALPWEGKCR